MIVLSVLALPLSTFSLGELFVMNGAGMPIKLKVAYPIFCKNDEVTIPNGGIITLNTKSCRVSWFQVEGNPHDEDPEIYGDHWFYILPTGRVMNESDYARHLGIPL